MLISIRARAEMRLMFRLVIDFFTVIGVGIDRDVLTVAGFQPDNERTT